MSLCTWVCVTLYKFMSLKFSLVKRKSVLFLTKKAKMKVKTRLTFPQLDIFSKQQTKQLFRSRLHVRTSIRIFTSKRQRS